MTTTIEEEKWLDALCAYDIVDSNPELADAICDEPGAKKPFTVFR